VSEVTLVGCLLMSGREKAKQLRARITENQVLILALAVRDVSDSAKAVMLQFEHPIGMVERFVRSLQFLRSDAGELLHWILGLMRVPRRGFYACAFRTLIFGTAFDFSNISTWMRIAPSRLE